MGEMTPEQLREYKQERRKLTPKAGDEWLEKNGYVVSRACKCQNGFSDSTTLFDRSARKNDKLWEVEFKGPDDDIMKHQFEHWLDCPNAVILFVNLVDGSAKCCISPVNQQPVSS